MKGDALGRKFKWVEETGGNLHTVVYDRRDVYDGGIHKAKFSGHGIYYKRGAGAFRLEGMHKVKDIRELQQLLNTPTDKLPEKAR